MASGSTAIWSYGQVLTFQKCGIGGTKKSEKWCWEIFILALLSNELVEMHSNDNAFIVLIVFIFMYLTARCKVVMGDLPEKKTIGFDSIQCPIRFTSIQYTQSAHIFSAGR